MSIEDVVLVSTVREDIRSHVLQVDSAEIPLRVEAGRLGALGPEIPIHLCFPKREASSTVDLKRVSAREGDDGLSAEEDTPGNMSMLKGKPARLMKNSRGAVAATRIVKIGTEALKINDIGIQRGGPNGVAIGMSTPNSKPPATAANEKLASVPPVTSRPGLPAPPVLPSYPVGRGISLPFGQLLPKCSWSSCSCNALIVWRSRIDTKQSGVVCLDHGLLTNSVTRDLSLRDSNRFFPYKFISPEHEAAIRAFLA